MKTAPNYPVPIYEAKRAEKSRSAIKVDVERGQEHITIDISSNVGSGQVRTLFADFVDLTRCRDGIRMLFGKVHSFTPDKLQVALDVSFPLKRFYNQAFRSVTTTVGRERSFRDDVERQLELQGGQRILGELPSPKDADRILPLRANFAAMSIFEDDVAVDLIHLDASTLRGIVQGANPKIDASALTRITMSPSLLLYFLDKLIRLAGELRTDIPNIEDPE